MNMPDGTSTSENAKSAAMSPLRLRVGVLFILLWLVPFWALAPAIAHSLSGLSKPPSVAAVTTAIVVLQTIIGLLGSWVAGTEVKSIIKGSTKRHALGGSGPYFFTGKSDMAATTRLIRMKDTHFATTPSRFGEAPGMPTPSIRSITLGTRAGRHLSCWGRLA